VGAQKIVHNLPQKTKFLNRQKEIENLERQAVALGRPLIAVWGNSGVGKTTLVNAFAWKLYDSPPNRLPADLRLSYIVWVTAKTHELQSRKKPFGKMGLYRRNMTRKRQKEGVLVGSVCEVCAIISGVVNGESNLISLAKRKCLEGKENYVREEAHLLLKTLARRNQWLLLVVDDIDSFGHEAKGEIFTFLEEEFPTPHVAVLTSRRHIDETQIKGVYSLPLGPMPESELQKLVREESTNLGVRLSDKDIDEIIRFAQGNPLVARLTVSMLKRKTGISVSSILREWRGQKTGLQFLFESLFRPLSDLQKKMLRTITVLEKEGLSYDVDFLADICVASSKRVQEELQEIERTLLLEVVGYKPFEVNIHRLVQEYILQENPKEIAKIERGLQGRQ